jgi:NTE family protein
MKLGLALGGGGARAAAHIGVLLELERLNITPDLVVGTSAGALIGTLLAYGVSAHQMKELFEQFGFTRLFSFNVNTPALTTPEKFSGLLYELIGKPTFADMKIPLAMIATNLVSGQEVILDEGDVTSALHASMAYPILLPPVERDGLTLIDGGLVNQVPFDVVRARGATAVIAVDLGNASPYGTEPIKPATSNLFERMLNATKRRPTMQLITAVSDIITSRAVQSRLAVSKPDIMLRPPIGTIGLLDFHSSDEAIEIGRNAVRDAEEEINKLIKRSQKK